EPLPVVDTRAVIDEDAEGKIAGRRLLRGAGCICGQDQGQGDDEEQTFSKHFSSRCALAGDSGFDCFLLRLRGGCGPGFGALNGFRIGDPQHGQAYKEQASGEIAERDGNLVPEPPCADGNRSSHPYTGGDDEHVYDGVFVSKSEEGEDGQPAGGDLAQSGAGGESHDYSHADHPVAENGFDDREADACCAKLLISQCLCLRCGYDQSPCSGSRRVMELSLHICVEPCVEATAEQVSEKDPEEVCQ